MSVEELPVAVSMVTAEAARGPVVDFDELLQREEQESAAGAPSLLLLEQGGLARRQLGVAPQPARPRLAQYSRSPS